MRGLAGYESLGAIHIGTCLEHLRSVGLKIEKENGILSMCQQDLKRYKDCRGIYGDMYGLKLQ